MELFEFLNCLREATATSVWAPLPLHLREAADARCAWVMPPPPAPAPRRHRRMMRRLTYFLG